jgi:bacteriorhodopsin
MSKAMSINSTDPIYFTFFTAYIALAGTTVITFLGALGDYKFDHTRYIKYSLVTETCVNIIAGLTYSYIMMLLDGKGLKLNKVTPIRYIDWALTTPLLIISFVLYLTYYDNEKDPQNKDKKPNFAPLGYIIPLNFIMLFFGFLGETGRMDKMKALYLGFAAYAGMFAGIYEEYIKHSKYDGADTIYAVFTFVWFLYGVAYLLDTVAKNIVYNFLDVISKAGFGILIWLTTFNIEN